MSVDASSSQSPLSQSPCIVVVGSINMDLVTRVAHIPRPGETITARNLQESPGGKGANQAVAVARLGAPCRMVGCVGSDGFGDRLLQSLHSDGVQVQAVRRVPDCPSGLAFISVEDSGENAITIIPGANGLVTPEDVTTHAALFQQASVLLLQLEIPVETVEVARQLARQHGVLVLLDPAPVATTLPASLLDVEVLCPNVTEAETLTGMAISDNESAMRAVCILHNRGVRHALITLGAKGVMVCDHQGQCQLVPAFSVETQDTTAAGDAFAAGMGVALAEGRPVLEAVRFGCAAGALATTRPGAQQAMPTRAELERLLQS